MWDQIRLLLYGRIEDVERFTVDTVQNRIYFDGIWDNDQTYAFPTGQHGVMTRIFQDTVYVSNVWNHAMDTYDKNPCMGKVTH